MCLIYQLVDTFGMALILSKLGNYHVAIPPIFWSILIFWTQNYTLKMI